MKCSVITVTYNDPIGLRATLASLCGEFRDWLGEVLVVDSSPEVSAAVVEEFRNQLPMKHLVAPREGIYGAMNFGLGQAMFPVVWFLNGGDLLDDGIAVREACRLLGENGADAVCARARLFRQGNYVYTQPPPRDLWAGIKNGNAICHQAVLYRKESFEHIFPFRTQFKLVADFDLHLRAWIAGKRMVASEFSIVRYDMSGASANFEEVLKEYGRAVASVLPTLPLLDALRIRAGLAGEKVRIRFLKRVSQGIFGGALRPLWLYFKRWQSR